MATALFVIAPGNFRDEELFHVREELEKAGIRTRVASVRKGEFVGKLGGKASAELAVGEAHASDYDAVIFVGGPGVMMHGLPENKDVLGLARDANEACRVLAAICIAPKILGAAGVVRGKRLTAFADDEAIGVIERAGGTYTGSDIEMDESAGGKLITADGPESAREFGRRIVKELLS